MKKFLKTNSLSVALAALSVMVLLSSCVGSTASSSKKSSKNNSQTQQQQQQQPTTSNTPTQSNNPTASNNPNPTNTPVVTNEPTPTMPPLIPVPSNEPVALPVSMAAITSYRGVMQELSSESGVPLPNAAITTAFNAVSSSMTSSGEALSISPDMTGALFEMGSRFCGAAVTREAALAVNAAGRVLFPNVNFAATTLAAGTRANMPALIARLTARFWQRAPSQAELTRLDAFQAGLAVANSAQGNQDLAVTLCSVIAGALQGFLSI